MTVPMPAPVTADMVASVVPGSDHPEAATVISDAKKEQDQI